MGYINIYHKSPARRAIRALEKAQEQAELPQEVKKKERIKKYKPAICGNRQRSLGYRRR